LIPVETLVCETRANCAGQRVFAEMGGGFEFRVFYVGDFRDDFEAHAREAFPELKRREIAAEERTDLYISCREDVGAKVTPLSCRLPLAESC
jgi:hypothetical protein